MKLLLFLRSFAFALLFATIIVQGIFLALGISLESIWRLPILFVIAILSIPMYFVVDKKIFKRVKVISKKSYLEKLNKEK